MPYQNYRKSSILQSSRLSTDEDYMAWEKKNTKIHFIWYSKRDPDANRGSF